MGRNTSTTTIIILAALVFTLLLMTACSALHPLVGSWDCSMAIFTFNKDGTLTISSESQGLNIEGTYELVDSDTISVNYPDFSGEADFSISEGVLTMNDGSTSVTCTQAK